MRKFLALVVLITAMMFWVAPATPAAAGCTREALSDAIADPPYPWLDFVDPSLTIAQMRDMTLANFEYYWRVSDEFGSCVGWDYYYYDGCTQVYQEKTLNTPIGDVAAHVQNALDYGRCGI